MANTFGQAEERDDSGWHNNKEMNPAANSSVTDEGLLKSDDKGNAAWRDANADEESGNAGKAGGEENSEFTNS